VIPDPPPEPEYQSDNVATAQYLEDLKQYQAEVDQIQAAYQAEVEAYQAKADVYQSEVIAYQQDYAQWQITRNASIGKAEGMIEPFHRDFGWTFENKEELNAYWSRITKTWTSQSTIILILFIAILILIRRKDKAK